MVTAYLALGANLGDREGNLREALRRLGEKLKVISVSSIYETVPVGFGSQPDFLNTVCEVSTNLSPEELLKLAKGIETTMGREPSFRNAPRPIDIDILLYDQLMLDTPDLTIPHPRLTERAFVLVPLAEIAARVPHPLIGETVADLKEKVDASGVIPWSGDEGAPPRH